MKTVLLCSSNPLLVKNLYGMIRDEGYAVEQVEHPASAVQKVLERPYEFMIVDAEPFGLSAGDAARIVASIAPGMPVFCVGEPFPGGDLPSIPLSDDLDATKRMIHRIAAGDRTTTAVEGRPVCSRRM